MDTKSNALSFDTLRSGLAGRIIVPGDADYDASRVVTYGGIDKKPAVMVRTRNAGDVKQAVNFARDNGLELAVRSGGHSAAGHSTTDGGLVVDMREMKAIEIDAAGKTAWAEAGATALEVTEAATAQGLVVGFGDAGSVGLGGITTGGGVGYLSRKYGLRSIRCWRRKSSPPMAASSRPTRRPSPTCSGRSAAAAAISASSPASSSSSTRCPSSPAA